MKFSHQGKDRVVPANHIMYDRLLKARTDEDKSYYFAKYEELMTDCEFWKADYHRNQEKNIYNPQLGYEASQLVNRASDLAGERGRKSLGIVHQYYTQTGGWKSFAENTPAVLRFWYSKEGSNSLTFEDRITDYKLAFCTMMERVEQFWEAVSNTPKGLIIVIESLPEVQREYLLEFGKFKAQFELFLNVVYKGKAKLTEINFSNKDSVLIRGKYSVKKQLAEPYPTSVTNYPSFLLWKNWVYNFLWGKTNRYFAFLTWTQMSDNSTDCQVIENMDLTDLPVGGFGFISESLDVKSITIEALSIGSGSTGEGADVDSMGTMTTFSPVFPLARFETPCGELLKLRLGDTYTASFFAGIRTLSGSLNGVIDISKVQPPQHGLSSYTEEEYPTVLYLDEVEKPVEDETMETVADELLVNPDEYLTDEMLAEMYPHHRPGVRRWYHNLKKTEDAANLKFKQEQDAIRAEMLSTTGKLDYTKCDEYSIPGYVPEGTYDDENQEF